MKISDLTIENIQSGAAKAIIPEFYLLKNTVENSRSFHKNDSVFDHTLRVTDHLLTLLKQYHYPELNNIVDHYTRTEILYLASIFHDIGKKDTLIIKDGITSCPGHEAAGCKQTAIILERFDLSPPEKTRTLELIKYHQAIFDLLSSEDPELDKKVAEVLVTIKDYLPEIIIFTIADIKGSQLNETKPEEFRFRIGYLENMLR